LPKLTPEQAASHTWVPDEPTWRAIKKHSVAGPATVSIAGLSANDPVSLGQVSIQTSKDPLGAPLAGEHLADELLAQLFAQRALAGLLF
jgi:hypothetical protein